MRDRSPYLLGRHPSSDYGRPAWAHIRQSSTVPDWTPIRISPVTEPVHVGGRGHGAAAPADDGSICPEAAGVAGADAEAGEPVGRGIRRSVLVEAPADDAAVGAEAAGVVVSGVDRGEGLGGRIRLAGPVVTPARQLPMTNDRRRVGTGVRGSGFVNHGPPIVPSMTDPTSDRSSTTAGSGSPAATHRESSTTRLGPPRYGHSP